MAVRAASAIERRLGMHEGLHEVWVRHVPGGAIGSGIELQAQRISLSAQLGEQRFSAPDLCDYAVSVRQAGKVDRERARPEVGHRSFTEDACDRAVAEGLWVANLELDASADSIANQSPVQELDRELSFFTRRKCPVFKKQNPRVPRLLGAILGEVNKARPVFGTEGTWPPRLVGGVHADSREDVRLDVVAHLETYFRRFVTLPRIRGLSSSCSCSGSRTTAGTPRSTI